MGFINNHDDILNFLQDLVYEVLTHLYKDHADDLKVLMRLT